MTSERKKGIIGGLKDQFKATMMRWSRFGGQATGVTVGNTFNGAKLRSLLPGSNYDYEAKAGALWDNSVVAICIGWIARNFPEPRLTVEERRGSEWVDNPEHPILEGLESPNTGYDDDVLWAATILSLKTDGNAYWVKARSPNGRTEYWYVPHWEMKPVWSDSGTEFIGGYVHTVDGHRTFLRVDQVIHFREGIDPDNQRLGRAELKTCIREVCSDNEANNYVATILRNMGVTAVVIMPENKEDTIDDLERQDVADTWKKKTTGEQRGSALVFSSPMKIVEAGASPDKMAIDKIRQIPEARIAAACGVDPMVAGLSVGTGTRTFSNLREANRHTYENCLMPMQKSMAKTIQRQSPEYLPNRREARLVWDYSEVSALREDQTELTKRTVVAYQGGVMTQNEARTRLNLKPRPDGDVCLAAPTVKSDLPGLGHNDVEGETE